MWLIISIVLINVFSYISEKYRLAELVRLNKRSLVFAALGIIITAAGFFLYAGNKSETAFSNVLPSQVVKKIASTDISSRNVQERFVFYRDALKIVRDYPLFGTGGGGWEAIYTKYQSYLYYTTKVHSHLFQIWVETGIPGLAAYAFLLFSLILVIWRLFKCSQSRDERFLFASLSAAIGAIILHSLIDFNLSLGAIAVLMWSLIAILSSFARRYSPINSNIVKQKWTIKAVVGVAFVTPVALFLISASFAVAMSYAQKGSVAVEKWILPEAVKNYERAFRYDPLKGLYAADLAQSLHYLGDPVDNFDMVREAKKHAESAQKLSPYDTQIKIIKAKIQLSLSEIPEAVKEYEEAREIFPYDQKGYDNLAEVYFKVAQYYTLKGKPQEAKVYFEKTKTVPDMVNEQLSKLNPKYRDFWVAGPMLEVSPTIDKYAKEADKLISQMR
jgi:tetratricopeptide (TPR) repeat protein